MENHGKTARDVAPPVVGKKNIARRVLNMDPASRYRSTSPLTESDCFSGFSKMRYANIMEPHVQLPGQISVTAA
jgi:hypothetical protein